MTDLSVHQLKAGQSALFRVCEDPTFDDVRAVINAVFPHEDGQQNRREESVSNRMRELSDCVRQCGVRGQLESFNEEVAAALRCNAELEAALIAEHAIRRNAEESIRDLRAEVVSLNAMREADAEVAYSLRAERDQLKSWKESAIAKLKDMDRQYLLLMEAGRDRISDLGGDCDPLDVMERGSPVLISLRKFIAESQPAPLAGGQPEAAEDSALVRCLFCNAKLSGPGGFTTPRECCRAGTEWDVKRGLEPSEKLPGGRCAICGKPNDIGELCETCAKGNDPFSTDLEQSGGAQVQAAKLTGEQS